MVHLVYNKKIEERIIQLNDYTLLFVHFSRQEAKEERILIYFAIYFFKKNI